jgi:hypothetical protein
VQGSLCIRERNVITEFPVVLLELSGDACLVESFTEVPAPSEGELDLRIDGHASRDMVRVVRCHSLNAGHGAYRIAAKFVGAVSEHDSVFPT